MTRVGPSARLSLCASTPGNINVPAPTFSRMKSLLVTPKEVFPREFIFRLCSRLAVLEFGTLGSGDKQPSRSCHGESLGCRQLLQPALIIHLLWLQLQFFYEEQNLNK